MEKRIYIKESEKISEVIEKIRHFKEGTIILHVPESSELKSSLDNFHAIKRESIIGNIEIVVESLDSFILELAALAKIKAVNPLFGEEEKVFSDIIPRYSEGKTENNSEDFVNDDDVSENENSQKNEEEKNKYDFLKFTAKKDKKPPLKRKSSVVVRSRRFKIYLILVILFLIFVGFVGNKILPNATVYLELKRIPVQFDNSVLVSVEVGDGGEISEDIFLVGQLVSAGKNIEMKFQASESDFVELRSEGDVYIYNTFTTENVSLVERTRFLSPGGKTYRTQERITVPGATEGENGLVPSRIRAKLLADEPGESFNVNPGPDEKWTIPGFRDAGSMDFYNGMHGVPTGSFSGGFIGETFFPNEEDISMAVEEAENAISDALMVELEIISSTDLVFLRDTRELTILESSIDKIADKDGKFGVFIDAEMKIFAIKKWALESALIDITLPESERRTSELSTGFDVVESNIVYDDVDVDWEEGEVNFRASGSIVIKPSIEEEILKEQLKGKKESEINAIILTVPYLSRSNVSLWPRWVKRIPEKDDKVSIVVD